MLKLLALSFLVACAGAAHRAPAAPTPIAIQSKPAPQKPLGLAIELKNVVLNGAELTAAQRTQLEAVIGPLAPGRYYVMGSRYLGREGEDATRDLEPMIEAYEETHGRDGAIALLVGDSCSMWVSGDVVLSNCESPHWCGTAER